MIVHRRAVSGGHYSGGDREEGARRVLLARAAPAITFSGSSVASPQWASRSVCSNLDVHFREASYRMPVDWAPVARRELLLSLRPARTHPPAPMAGASAVALDRRCVLLMPPNEIKAWSDAWPRQLRKLSGAILFHGWSPGW